MLLTDHRNRFLYLHLGFLEAPAPLAKNLEGLQ